jgi:hypothetical protein
MIEHTNSELIFKKISINASIFAIKINKQTKEWSFYTEYFEQDFVRKLPVKVTYNCLENGTFRSNQPYFLSNSTVTNLFQALLLKLKKMSKYNVWLLTQTHVPKGVYYIWNNQSVFS